MSGMYWYAVAASDDVAGLKNKGFCVNSDGEILYNEQYEYALARMYTHDGHGIVDVETSNFTFDKDANDRITINAEDPMTTPVLSYKLRMTDQYPDAEWFYFAADKSEEIIEDGVPHPLYKADGTLATKADYADCEFEALNPMPSEEVGMYGRFTTATFSFATYQSTADVLHVEFTGLHQEDDEYCFADRLRVVVTASPEPTPVPVWRIAGGMIGPDSRTDFTVPIEPYYYTVDNIFLVGMMPPMGGMYAPAPSLPTVSSGGFIMHNNPVTITAGATNSDFYIGSTGRPFVYDATKSYGVRKAMDAIGGNDINPSLLSLVDSSGELAVKNVSGSSITVEVVYVSVCSSSSATVITVYDSSNTPYNAFKYTSDGTDYYYVLDGTQTDWTDNLSSIGYHLPVEVVLKVKWGDTVNVPAGYTVTEVRTFVGYVFPSYSSYSQSLIVAYTGKDEYFDNITNHDLLYYSTPDSIISTWPVIEVFQGDQINYSDGPHMSGRRFTVGYKISTANWITSIRNTNGTDVTTGNYSIYMEGDYDSSASSVINSGKPARLLWFTWDSSSNSAVWHKSPEAFKVPQSLWSFSNGTFSWLGNSEDTSSLAWYYKHDWELFEWSGFDGVWFYVHCVMEE